MTKVYVTEEHDMWTAEKLYWEFIKSVDLVKEFEVWKSAIVNHEAELK